MSEFAIANLEKLFPINGMCYAPVPSDAEPSPPDWSKYFDSDFTNSDFAGIWGTDSSGVGRNDLKTLAETGVNFLHLYDWSVPPVPGQPVESHQRDHSTFLAACGRLGINVMIPISNYFVIEIHNGNGATVQHQIAAMVAEAYGGGVKPMPGVGMWSVANEFDYHRGEFSVADVVEAMAYLQDAERMMGVEEEDTLPICAPVSFGAPNPSKPPSVPQLEELRAAVSANSALGMSFWQSRIVAAVNPQNPGDFLKPYIETEFPAAMPGVPFFFAEMGIFIDPHNGAVKSEAEQADYVLGQLQAAVPSGNFLGACVFQYLDQTRLKSGTEATFGATKYAGTWLGHGRIPAGYDPGGGQSYPIDNLTRKPMFASVQKVFNA